MSISARKITLPLPPQLDELSPHLSSTRELRLSQELQSLASRGVALLGGGTVDSALHALRRRTHALLLRLLHAVGFI